MARRPAPCSRCLPGLFRLPLKFITIHYAYFTLVPFVASFIFWGASNPSLGVSYVDSLFMVVSAMTETGLNTVNLSQLNIFQQVLLWLLIIVGSSVWVSIWTIAVRKYAFKRHLTKIARWDGEKADSGSAHHPGPASYPEMVTFAPSPEFPNQEVSMHRKFEDMGDLARAVVEDASHRGHAGNTPMTTQDDAKTSSSVVESSVHRRYVADGDTGSPLSHLPSKRCDVPTEHIVPVHRTRSGDSLTRHERLKLGGTEYRALRFLSVLVPVYALLWQLIGSVALGAWIANNQPRPAWDNGISPWWNGIFNGVSAFNNSGMSVLDANMIPFQDSYFVLLTMGAMILAGNTAFPLFLRLGVWLCLKCLHLTTGPDELAEWKRTLEYILRYPRRLFLYLFPSRQTWWLVFMIFILSGIDWIAFVVLNIGNAAIEALSPASRAIDGLFQAIAVRSGGFYVVPVSGHFVGLQLLYMIMMYISVYPVAISMRHSNVYEEKSLYIYGEETSNNDTVGPSRGLGVPRLLHDIMSIFPGSEARRAAVGGRAAEEESRVDFIGQQLRGQLSHDLWWLMLATLAIVIVETQHFLEDPATYSVFNVAFEVVSAYGCVGISTGVPGNGLSLSGGFYPGSKLILCAVMLRGRHRGLPVQLDHAIQLPGRHEMDGHSNKGTDEAALESTKRAGGDWVHAV